MNTEACATILVLLKVKVLHGPVDESDFYARGREFVLNYVSRIEASNARFQCFMNILHQMYRVNTFV
jgi:hypothetical protein